MSDTEKPEQSSEEASAPSFGERFRRWWFEDMPPLDGRLRILVYGGLFLLLWEDTKSPLRGISFYAQTEPQLFRGYGLIDLLNIAYVPMEIMTVVFWVSIVAWLCAAAGLFFRVTDPFSR